VSAFRVPFPEFCGRVDKHSSTNTLGLIKAYHSQKIKASECPCNKRNPEEVGSKKEKGEYEAITQRLNKSKPLEVIVKAASYLQDFSVFKKPSIVHAMVKYKWSVIKNVFYWKFAFFVVYLGLANLLGYFLAETPSAAESSPDMNSFINATSSECSPDMNWFQVTLNNSYVKIGLCVLILLLSLWLLLCEGVQFWNGWETTLWRAIKEYLLTNSWNLFDLLGPSGQIVTVVLLYQNNPGLAKMVSAYSQLVLFWKLMFYARGFIGWGQFVRLIQRTLLKMFRFMLILLFIMSGFAMAFYTLLKADTCKAGHPDFKNFLASLISVSMMIYGQFDMGPDGVDIQQNGVAIVFFELVMIICVVLLLNLLIAILSESYEEVKSTADEETMFELANIVIELERENRYCVELCPRYVHVLKADADDGISDRSLKIEKALKTIQEEINAVI